MDGFELPTGSHFAWPGGGRGRSQPDPIRRHPASVARTSGFSVAYGERASALVDVDLKTGAHDALRGRVDATAGGVLGLRRAGCPLPGGGGRVVARVDPRAGASCRIAFSRGESRGDPQLHRGRWATWTCRCRRAHRLHVLGPIGRSLDVDWSSSSDTTHHRQPGTGLAGVRLESAWSTRTQTAVSVSWASYESRLNEVEQTHHSFQNRVDEHVAAGARGGAAGGGARRRACARAFATQSFGRRFLPPGRRVPERVEHRGPGRPHDLAGPLQRRRRLRRGVVGCRAGWNWTRASGRSGPGSTSDLVRRARARGCSTARARRWRLTGQLGRVPPGHPDHLDRFERGEPRARPDSMRAVDGRRRRRACGAGPG